MSSTRGTSLPRNPDWRDHADCRIQGINPEGFFPSGTTGGHVLQAEQAKAFCRGCPVVESCARWAIDKHIEHGVWGGLDEDQRRHIRRSSTGDQLNDAAHVGRVIRAAWQYDAVGRLVDTFLSRTVQEDDGHVRWLSNRTSNYTIGGRVFTPRQLSFEIKHGRRPVGIVRTDCGESYCVAGEHLTDNLIRWAREHQAAA